MSDLAAARANMVESQVRTQDVTDVAIHDAMRAIPREQLCPAGKAYLAYADVEVEYAPGRWLLKPRDLAKLLQGLRPRPGESALAIAAPYAAMVLEAMGLSVSAVEGETLTALPGTGYDLIVVEGAVASAPAEWLRALAPGGRLGVVERSGPIGRAMLYLKTESTIGERPLFDATPPVLAGFEAAEGFAL